MLNDKSIDDANLEKVNGGVKLSDGTEVTLDVEKKVAVDSVQKKTNF